MHVLIHATNLCNFRCKSCHLTNEQRAEAKPIDLDLLRAQLQSIADSDGISEVTITGGEPALLTEAHWQGIVDSVATYYPGIVSVETNFSRVHKGFLSPKVLVSVGYALDTRQNSECVRANMKAFPNSFQMRLICTEKLLKINPDIIAAEIRRYQDVKLHEVIMVKTPEISHMAFYAFHKRLNDLRQNEGRFINQLLIQGEDYDEFHIYVDGSAQLRSPLSHVA